MAGIGQSLVAGLCSGLSNIWESVKSIFTNLWSKMKQGFTDEDRNEYRRLMRRFGMYKMSGAVMYVLREVFGMPDEWLIVEPHERCGRMLLEEIMKAGNFGHYDERIGERDRQSKLRMNILRLKRDVRMMSYFPSECLSEPFFRLYHFFWRRRVIDI